MRPTVYSEEQKVTDNSQSLLVSGQEQTDNVRPLKRVLFQFQLTALTRSLKRIVIIIVIIAGFAFTNTLPFCFAAQAATIQNLNLVNGWLPMGDPYASPELARDNGMFSVGGVIRGGSWTYFALLPSDAAPTQKLIFQVNNHDQTTRIDVLSNGYVAYAGGSTNYGWVSLEGIKFVRSGGTALTLLNGWTNFGGEYTPATVSKVGNTVVLQGLVRNDKAWSTSVPITTLPEGMRPSARMVFGGSVHNSVARIDVLPNGDVFYVNGKGSWDWLSLSGITFTVGSTSSLSLASGWSNFGNGYALAGIATSGALRPVTGLLAGSNGQIATLPSGITVGRRIFSVMKGDQPGRVDLLPDGRLFYIIGGGTQPTLSLSNILIL